MYKRVLNKNYARCVLNWLHFVGKKTRSPRNCRLRNSVWLARRLQHSDNANGPELTKSNNSTYPLPWPHNSKAIANLDPLLHRLCGLFLVSSIARKCGHKFSRVDFLHGVSDAVYSFADILADKTRHIELEYLLAPMLYTAVSHTLDKLPEDSQINTEVESVRGARICEMNTIFGDAQPGDRHAVLWLGQSVVTSKSKLESLLAGNKKFTFNRAQDIGKEAALSRLEFRIGVSFLTKERFCVYDSEGRTIQGSDEYRDCFHLWRFSSLVDWEREDDLEYPFDWTILDINNHVLNQVVS